MARAIKAHDFHVRLTEEEAASFLRLVARLELNQSDVIREALSLYLAIAALAPPELARFKLAVWLEDFLSSARIVPLASLPAPATNGDTAPDHHPTIADRNPTTPARTDPRQKAHKRR